MRNTAIAAMAAGLMFLATGGNASADVAADQNHVAYWCGTAGVKYDPVTTPFVVPAPPAGTVWTKLVLKASTENRIVLNPVVGQAYTSGIFNANGSEQAISHVILCYEPSATTTSTTTSTSTTTTQPDSTTSTTQPGSTTSTTQPGSTTSTTQPDSTTSTTQPATTTTTQPATTTTAATTTTTQPATTTTTVPASTTTVNVGQGGPTTTTLPGSTTSQPGTSTPSSVAQAGPTSSVGQAGAANPAASRLPATGSGGGSANLTVLALTLIGVGAVMLRLASKPAR